MKICYDMLEGVSYNSKSGYFRKGNTVYYIYKESCVKCGESYLMNKHNPTYFCSVSCIHKDKKTTNETRKKMSKSHKGKEISEKTRENRSRAQKGRKHSTLTKRKMSISAKNKAPVSIATRNKMSKNHADFSRKNNPRWKGGYCINNIPLYNAYTHQISYAEKVRRNQKDFNILEVRCTYCGRWFIPTLAAVHNRIGALNGREGSGEARFYCSEGCKKSCPIFKQILYPKDFKPVTSREVQAELRQLVLARDNYKCQRCEKTIDEIELHCHHIEPVSQNPIESADMDNCITFCKNCHKKVHKLPGCGYHELKCLEVKKIIGELL